MVIKINQNTKSLKELRQIADNVSHAANSEKSKKSSSKNSVFGNLTTNTASKSVNIKNLSPKQIQEYKNSLEKNYVIQDNDELDDSLNSSDIKIKNEDDLKQVKKSILKDIDKTFSDENISAILDNALNINGKIDEQVKQQGTGDCYLLTTLNTLSKTDKGKQIIRDAISYNPKDKTYSVTFKGVGQTYTFTEQEIIDADLKNHDKVTNDGNHVTGEGKGWYSEGDNDALLIEMAFEKFRLDCADGKFDDKKWPSYAKSTGSYDGTDPNKSSLNSGNMKQVLYALTGKGVKKVNAKGDKVHKALDKIMKDVNNGKPYAIYAAVSGKMGYTKNAEGDYYVDKNGKFRKVNEKTPKNSQRYSFDGVGENSGGHITLSGVGDCEGQSIDISNNGTGGHALAISKITDDTVTIINPWDSKKEVTVKREDFEKYMKSVEYAKL